MKLTGFVKAHIRQLSLLLGITATVAVIVAVTPGIALTPSTFEVDGNLVLNKSGNEDWCRDLPAPATPATCNTKAPAFVSQEDIMPRSDDNSFGQGTKEDTAVPSVVTGSIPPNKSDLSRFYVSNESVGGKAFMYLAWERINSLGTANMDFEFNKSSTLSSNGVTPVRSPGDILITFDFSSGGNKPKLGLSKWITTGPSSQCEASNTVPCWGQIKDISGVADAEGSVNDGFSTYDPIKGETEVSEGFGEAAIDLTDALNLGPNDCAAFGSAYLKSRSSDSFTSAVKDFVPTHGVSIGLCPPATISVKKVDSSNTSLGLPNATFELYRNDGTDASKLDSGDHLLDTCTTNSTGDCTFADVAGEGTISLLVHEKTPPAGYSGGQDQIFGVSFTTIKQSITRTFQDTVVPGTVNIHKQDDSSPANLLAGAEFTLYTDNAPLGPPDGSGFNQDSHGIEDSATSFKCTTNSSGDCSIGNLPLGKYWVVETKTPNGYSTAADQYANVSLGSQPNQGTTVNLTFVDPVVLGTVSIHKQNDASPADALAGAEFTLYTDNSPLGPADGSGPNQDSHGGEDTATTPKCTTDSSGDCSIGNVPLGRYWVVETKTPNGHSTAADKYANVGRGALPNQGTTVSLTFVDPIVPGTINIHKVDDSSPGNALAGAEFTLYSDSSPLGPADDSGPDQDSHGGEDTATTLKCTTNSSGDCSISDVPLDKYWVVETKTPTGYSAAADQYAQVVLGSQPNQGTTLNLQFVDPRQHKIIVIVCHQGTNTLDSSSVTVDGEVKQSEATPAGGVTEAQLCGQPGAAYDGKSHGSHSAAIDIPSH